MADSGQTEREAEPSHVDSEPSAATEPAEEHQKDQEGASVADQMAASEQVEGEGGNKGEEQEQPEREGSGEQVREDGAVDGEHQAKEDLNTTDGEMGAHVSESPLEQKSGAEPESEMGGVPTASETSQEGEGSERRQEEVHQARMELSGTGEPSAVEGQGGDANGDGGDAKDEGGDARVESGDAKDEGGDARVESGDAKDEGGNARVESGDAKDEGGDARVEGGDTKEEGDTVKAGGEVTKEDGEVVEDVAVDEAAEYECVEEEVGLSREEIIAHLREALATQEQLKAKNAQYQHKIAEYLAKKKTEEKHDPTRSVTDQEQRYIKCMNALEALQQEYAALAEKQCEEEADLVAESQHCLGLVDKQRKEHLSFCKQKSLASVYTRTGRHMTTQEFELLAAEDRKGEGDVVLARLENIRLSTSIAKKEALIRKKEELGDGLHVIDFEQLKIDNVNLNEKIEERNEDLVKLRRKITGTVQVLTHVKEKLQFVQAENAEKKGNLTDLERSLSLKRDRLTRLKQARDALRMDNIKLRHQGGLVGHLDLLRDFEEQVDKNDEAASAIQSHQQQQSEVLLACNRLQQKEATAAAWTQRGMV